MKLILASASKPRQNILNMVGLKYEVITSDVEEISNETEPDKYVGELSLNKAISVRSKINDKCIIIAADTIVYFNNKKYEKPQTREEAYQNLKEMSGKVNCVYTGVTIMDLYQNKTITFYSKTDVYFKDISKEEIKWYVNNESKILNCCGYVPSGKCSIFIDKIDGDYFNIFGLPISLVYDKLKELGYSTKDLEVLG